MVQHYLNARDKTEAVTPEPQVNTGFFDLSNPVFSKILIKSSLFLNVLFALFIHSIKGRFIEFFI